MKDPLELENLIPRMDTAGTENGVAGRLYECISRYDREWGDRDSEWGQAFWTRFEANGGLEAAVATMRKP
jgi:hypothetical protein